MFHIIRRIFSGINLLIRFTYLNLIVPKASEHLANSILIVRLDAIGDYILFRNFLQILKTHPKYSSYKITLVGNISWKAIAEEFDSKYVDHFIWVDRKKFNKSVNYAHELVSKVARTKYDIALHPVFSREFLSGDLVMHFAQAFRKIGFEGDSHNSRHSKHISNLFYSDLIPHQEKIKFEFARNKDFFDHFLRTPTNIQAPSLQTSNSFHKEENYAVIFIGSSHISRRWKVQHYADIGQFIQEKWKLKIVLCGGPDDLEDAKLFESIFNGKIDNLVGKLTLVELIHSISLAKLFLSNETGAVHIASALRIKNIFVLSNGNHLKRFCPHPDSNDYHLILPKEVEENLEYFIEKSNEKHFEPPNINDISVPRCKHFLENNYQDHL